ncbi:hypothetical protein Tco_1028706 [Tanacetum coccineum]|uniref:Uncharacterized protein n=1 Tax=Tanacetum coccineum TaxID=301880 RepID=A0ABQ5G2S2_9ASTR
MLALDNNKDRIGPSKSSQSLSIAHKWAVCIDEGTHLSSQSSLLYYWALPAISWCRLQPIVFFSSGSVTADSSRIDSVLAFFGLWP